MTREKRIEEVLRITKEMLESLDDKDLLQMYIQTKSSETMLKIMKEEADD